MKEIIGNIWYYHSNNQWIVVTTNGMLKSNGEAVMGKGIALQAKQRFPFFPQRLGFVIKLYGNVPHPFHDFKIISFPTKHHWANDSDINLIKIGCEKLVDGMLLLGLDVLYLPRLGCGNGNLNWENVKLVLEEYLDDRFIVVSPK